MSVTVYLLSIIFIWLLLNLAYKARREWFSKRNIEVGFVSLVWRSSITEKWTKVSRKYSRLINIYGYVSIPIAIATLAFALKIYLEDIIVIIRVLTAKITTTPKTTPTLTLPTPMVPIIPGLTVGFEILPYLLLALVVGVFLHELSHLMLSFRENIPVKSWGIIVFLVVPIPFVEPVEEEFRKRKLTSKVKVYASGPAANTTIALISLCLMIILIATLYSITLYPYIVDLMPGYPAQQYGVPKGTLVLSVNNSSVAVKPSPLDILFNPYIGLSRFIDELSKYRFRDTNITLTLCKPGELNKTITITIFKNSSVDKIGVYVTVYSDINVKVPFLKPIIPYLMTLLIWLFIVNLGLAIINITPLFITDGGKIVNDVLESIIRNRRVAKTISNIIQLAMVIIILSIIIYSTIKM